jgi:hypothetical protein
MFMQSIIYQFTNSRLNVVLKLLFFSIFVLCNNIVVCHARL